jgi:peptidylprolyl isomerase
VSQAKEAQDMKPSLSPGGIASMLVVLAVFIALAWLLINRAEALQPGDTAAEEPAHGEVAEAEEVIPAEGEAEEQAIVRTYDAPPPMTINPEHEYTATITTPRGDIRIRLFPEVAPQTVNNFVFLARNDFYDGLTWHRVIADFMVQGGDPAGTGTGGPGYSIPAEFSNELRFDQPGKVAMARSADPNSAGSQFFITTAPAPWLNGQYTIFGEVLEGQEIVNDIPLRDPAMATEPGEEIVDITITENEG